MQEKKNLYSKEESNFVYLFSVIGIVSLMVFGVVHLYFGDHFSSIFELGLAGLALVNALIFSKSKNFNLAGSLMLFIMLGVYILLLSNGGLGNTGIYWILVFAPLAIFLKGKKGLVWVGWLLFVIIGFSFIKFFNFAHISYTVTELRQIAIVLIVLTLIIYFYYRSNTNILLHLSAKSERVADIKYHSLFILKNFNVRTKIFAVASVLAAIILTITVLFIVREVRSSFSELVISESQQNINSVTNQIEIILDHFKSDVIEISKTPPIQGIYRAEANNGFDELDNSTLQQWKDRLTTILVSFIESEGLYDQIRYIDNTGQEVVRVNYKDGAAVIVKRENLQNKANRHYFIAASKLKPGEVYISNIYLNREGNPPTIQQPIKPVIVYAIPTFDEQGNFRGMIVANVLADNLIGDVVVHDLVSESGDFLLVDDQGYYIFNIENFKKWGGPDDFGSGYNFSQDFPQFLDIVDNQVFGSGFDNENLFAFAKIHFDEAHPERYIMLWRNVLSDHLLQPINNTINFLVLLSLVIFIVSCFIFLYFIDFILRPLKDLTHKAEAVSHGDFDVMVNYKSNDEIGILANSFNKMTRRLRHMYNNLSDEVEKKTIDLKTKVNDLETNKQAMLNLLEDIEAEKEKSHDLAKDLEKFRLAVENTQDHIIITDPNGVVLYANKAVEDITGFSPEEVLNHKAGSKELWGGLMDKEFYQNMWKILKVDKKSFSGQIKNKRKDGEEYFALSSISPILSSHTGEVEFFVAIERDITEEKRIDKAKSEFVSLASHQLRTPLTSIKWNIELLSDNINKFDKDQQESIHDISTGNQRMIDLVNALLNTSRIDLGTFGIEPEMGNIIPICESVLKELKPTIESKKINIKTDFGEIPDMSIDPNLVTIIFQNILSNAVKYTPDSGTVTVYINKDTKNVIISISDTGCGIPRKQQDKIFTKLFRAENVQMQGIEGTGLGLYVAKAILDESGGTIAFDSEEGKGTTFKITIPLSGMKEKAGAKGLSAT